MANPNISLLGATYNGVAGVTLPKSGGGTATFPWVEGSETKTQNGTYDVTNLAELVVNVSGGGGGSSIHIGVETVTLPQVGNELEFYDLLGNPTSFAVISESNIAVPSSGQSDKISAVVWDATDNQSDTPHTLVQYVSSTSGSQVLYVDDLVSVYTVTNGMILRAQAGDFAAATYTLIYTYGDGSGNNVDTKQVQVGSGATSITFTGLEGEPIYWSCIFTGNFSTSSGYTRTQVVGYDGTDIIGMEMGSGSTATQHWSASYSNGSLTISSQSTTQGGYFHQPGYYQLTYAYDSNNSYQTKSVTYTPSASTQTETITPDSGYEALKKVNVTVNAMPAMTLPTAASSTSSGTSKATITPTSSAQYLNIPTGYNATAQYYTIAASGGGGSVNVATKTLNVSSVASSISFTSLLGTPKAFFVRCTTTLSRNSSNRYYYVADMRWDGSATGGVAGNRWYMYNGQYSNITSGYSYSYSNGTLTLSSTGSQSASPGAFYAGTYELVYVY